MTYGEKYSIKRIDQINNDINKLKSERILDIIDSVTGLLGSGVFAILPFVFENASAWTNWAVGFICCANMVVGTLSFKNAMDNKTEINKLKEEKQAILDQVDSEEVVLVNRK